MIFEAKDNSDTNAYFDNDLTRIQRMITMWS